MKFRRTSITAAILAASITIVGCSVADPDSSQEALHYSGGPFSSQNFQNCINPGTREVDGPGDYMFYYPHGQRTFTFSDVDPHADRPPIHISTKDRQELLVRGTVTFTLNTDCTPYDEKDATGKVVRHWDGGVLQRFHDTIGRHTEAFASDGGDQQPKGWDEVLNRYIGDPAEKAMDNAALRWNWTDLYNNLDAKNAWQDEVIADLPRLIDQQAGAPHFIVNSVQLQKPDVSPTLAAELQNNAAAQLRKNTADTDQQAAQNFPGGIAGYLQYQQQLAVNDAIKSGKVQVIPIPQGSPVIVQPNR